MIFFIKYSIKKYFEYFTNQLLHYDILQYNLFY